MTLADAARPDAVYKRVDLELVGTDTVHGAYHSAEYVVQAEVLSGVLDAHHVLDAFDHAHS